MELKSNSNKALKERLFTVARKIGTVWSHNQRTRLANICQSALDASFGWYNGDIGISIQLKQAAVQALCLSPNIADLDILTEMDSTRYRASITYAFGRTGTHLDLLYKWINEDIDELRTKGTGKISTSAFWMAYALRRNAQNPVSVCFADNLVEKFLSCLINHISRESTVDNTILLSIGLIGDQRFCNSLINPVTIQRAVKYVSESFAETRFREKTVNIAYKLLTGEQLNTEDSGYLLKLFEDKK